MSKSNLGFGLKSLPLVGDTLLDIDMEQLKQMVDLFLHEGFTYFDTSYFSHDGFSEIACKEVLTKRYDRSSYTLATKLPVKNLLREDQVNNVFEEQLKKCGVEYFDYYLLEGLTKVLYDGADGKGGTVKNLKLFDYLVDLKVQGKIKHIGFSYFDDAQTLDLILNEHPEVEFVQLVINYLDMDSYFIQSRKCIETARKHGVDIIAVECAKSGLLSSIDDDILVSTFKKVQPLLTQASWALRYAKSIEGVVTVVSNMSCIEHLRDNISFMKDFTPLNEKELFVIEHAVDAYKAQWELKLDMNALSSATLHGVNAAAIVEAYNNARLHADPFKAVELNYIKSSLEQQGFDINSALPEQKVIIDDSSDVTDEVLKAESFLIKNSL